MDARINPAAALGLAEGDAHVIRNAGGRVSDDALRSLVISHKLLGTKEWFVVHHTDCGMEFFTGAQLAALLDTSLATANIVPAPGTPKGVAFVNAGAEGGSAAGHAIDWLHIDDQEASIKADVEKVVSSPLTAPGIPVHGYLCVSARRGGLGLRTPSPPPPHSIRPPAPRRYDVKTGKINHVVSAVTK
jgi:carbonic anhydrase